LDLGWAGLPADIGQIAESNRNAGAVAHAQRPDMVDAVTVLRSEPDADIVPLVAVLHGADGASAQRLDEVEHLGRIEPASCDLATIDDDTEIRLTNRLFCLHVGCPGDG